MKANTPFIAGLALALAPAAHAEISCVELTLVLQSAASKFEQLKGEPVKDEENVWRASFSLPGAGECDVWSDRVIGWFYDCADSFNTESQARSLYNANLASVASCLSAWTRQPLVKSFSPGKMLDGVIFIGAGSDSSLAAELELVEVEDKETGKFWAVSTLVRRRPG